MDRFSCLPDELLIHILSFLSTREAAVTSILSTRWRYLWKLTRRVDIGSYFSVHGGEVEMEKIKLEEARRVRLVDSVLSSFGPDSVHPIHEFLIRRSYFCTDIAHHVERWILLALRHNVRVLSLKLCLQNNFEMPRYSFPLKLMHLHLISCNLINPSFEVFGNLRSISLWSSFVTDGAFESIKLNCALLEELNLENVYGLRNPSFSSALYHLKYLKMIGCRDLQTVVIESPNLASLDFREQIPIERMFVKLAPRLRQVKLRLDQHSLSSALSLLQGGRDSSIGKIDMLALNLPLGLENFDHSRPCPLNHVKELRLKVGSKDFTSLEAILRASLSLETLNLLLVGWKSDPLMLPLGSCGHWKHQNLQRIQISGFHCMQFHLQIVKYLVEVVAGLEEITIICDKFCDLHDDCVGLVTEHIGLLQRSYYSDLRW